MATLAIVAGVAVAAPAIATTNLVTNGGFEEGYVNNTEFGTSFPSGAAPTDWTASGYNLFFSSATATTVSAVSTYGPHAQTIWVAPASPNGGNFVALDGDSTVAGPMSQFISGLTAGKTYNVSFYWGAAQLHNRTGKTTEQLQVSLGGASQLTGVTTNASHGFSGWVKDTLSFKATDATELLSFLSKGTPDGLPPLALLDGVSVTAVPEPATWVLMIAGFGMVGVAARYRKRSVVAA